MRSSRIQLFLKLLFLGFNALLLLFAFVLVAKHVFYEVIFFNRDLTPEQILNNTQAGFTAGPEAIRLAELDFRPSDRARSLILLLDCADIEGDYEWLRLSSRPEISSGIFTVRRGKISDQTLWTLPAGEKYRIKLRFDYSRLDLEVNDQLIHRQPYEKGVHTLDFLFFPVPIINFFPHVAIGNIRIVTAGRAGSPAKTWESLSDRTRAIGAAFAALGAWALVLSLFAWSLRRWRRHRGLMLLFNLVFSGWLLIPLLLAVLFFANRSAMKTQCPYGVFFTAGQFNRERFQARPALYGRPFVLNPRHVRIFAFGESTTVGEPYPPGTYDWPTQLQKIIDHEKPFGDIATEVYNLGYSGSHLQTLIPPGSAPFFEATKPQIVILHTMINSYLDITEMNFVSGQIFGLKSPEAAFRFNQDGLNRYAAHLDQTLKTLVSAGALPVMIVPELDKTLFQGNPLAPLQAVAVTLAQKYNAPLVMQEDANRKAGEQPLYHEFVHPNKIGYRLLAQAVYDEIAKNKDRVARPIADRIDAE